MPPQQRLEPYELSGPSLTLLQQSFNLPMMDPMLELYRTRPRPSRLRQRLAGDLSIKDAAGGRHAPEVLEAVLRAVSRAWDDFTEGSVPPSDFMRTPVGASTLMFLLLPQRALEAILLLPNAHPDDTSLTDMLDIPIHRLLDQLKGVMCTNDFAESAKCGRSDLAVGALLLRGSLFNHSDRPSLARSWDPDSQRMTFTTRRDIRQGEELVIDYAPQLTGAEKGDQLSKYGIN